MGRDVPLLFQIKVDSIGIEEKIFVGIVNGWIVIRYFGDWILGAGGTGCAAPVSDKGGFQRA